jgi:hypothetical protein
MTDCVAKSAAGGRRLKTSKGGNCGKGYVSRCGTLYGDLAAAGRDANGSRRGRASPADEIDMRARPVLVMFKRRNR